LARSILEACTEALTRIGCLEIAEKLATQEPGGRGPLAFLVDQLRDILDQLPQAGKRSHLVICLDEIAMIMPKQADFSAQVATYQQFAGMLRVLVEEDSRMSLVVADLNPDVGRIHGWKSEQNPLYQKVTERWLLPMEKVDCQEMISYLSRRMRLEEEAIVSEIAFAASGGYPFLARQLCSRAYKMLQDQGGKSRKLSATIARARAEFLVTDSSLLDEHGLWGQIADPDTWGETGGRDSTQLLEGLAKDGESLSKAELLGPLREAGAGHGTALKVLVERGIVSTDGERYWITFGLFRDYIRTRVSST
jgi:hypothetical protein